jgi:hypothetical protein
MHVLRKSIGVNPSGPFKMKFTAAFIATTTTLLTITNAATDGTYPSIATYHAPSLATCPKKEGYLTCEAENWVFIDACNATVDDPPSNATRAELNAMIPATAMACSCDAHEKSIKQCGPLCPEVIDDFEKGEFLDLLKEGCPGIEITINSGSRGVAVSAAVIFMAILLM